MDLIDRLIKHDHWATAQLLGTSLDLTDAQLDQEFDIGHRTLRATYDHMFFNVEAWTRVATGQPIEGIERDADTIAVLIERHEESYGHFTAFARRMRDEQRLDDTFIDHFGGHMTFGGAIIHIVLHNEGHRSEVLHILQRLDVLNLPEVDHGLWDLTVRSA